jgi:host factor-I protein
VQVSESRPASPIAAGNIQDVFLNSARRDRLAVTIHLMNGRQLEARIKNFDKFAVIVEVEGFDQLVFKHAIAAIETRRSMASYVTANS